MATAVRMVKMVTVVVPMVTFAAVPMIKMVT